MSSKFEELRIYQAGEEISDKIWDIVVLWDHFKQDTVGKQIVRSADSIAANIAEGAGRGSDKENARFVKIARGSLFETKHWLKKSRKRNLINETDFKELSEKVEKLLPSISKYINYLLEKARKSKSKK